MSLLPVAEAQRRLLSLATPLTSEQIALEACAGRRLASALLARRDQPWADVSVMDGYAVIAADGAAPRRIVTESAAGDAMPARSLQPGEAARIFTGAPLPPGADSVIIQEDVTRTDDYISIDPSSMPRPGLHVRRRGNDFADGADLLPAGTRLGPRQLALAALAGHGALPVYCRPRVAIIQTGSELIPPGTLPAPGQLPASNGLMLRAMLEDTGAVVMSERLVTDDLEETVRLLRDAHDADIIVTCGGASVGDHDLVRPAIMAVGGTIDFWKIAMRPGKPLIAGRLGNALLLGLPGNPVSAFVTGTLFLLPLVRHLMGDPAPFPASTLRPLAAPVAPGGDREDYQRATTDANGTVCPMSVQDSAQIRTLACADCLIIRPAGAPAAPAGELVPVIPLT